MKNRISGNSVVKNAFIWWIGWLSIGLVEVGLRCLFKNPPLTSILFLIMLLYSCVGMVLGSFCGITILLYKKFFDSLKEDHSHIFFSMAACIFTITLLYVMLFFRKMQNLHDPLIIFKTILFGGISISVLFLVFFFRWMNKKGRLYTSYIAIAVSLWIVTSLGLFRFNEMESSIFKLTPLSFFLSLLLILFISFFTLFTLIMMLRRSLEKRNSISLLKIGLVGLPLLLLFLLSPLFFGETGYKDIEIISKGKDTSTGKPNVLLIILDAVRADHISCYGYERLTTPNLDRFSREGVIFKNAYSTAPWTTPSIGSIFTGMYPSRHGAHYNSEVVIDYFYKAQNGQKINAEKLFWSSNASLSKENHTVAELLLERGYRTAGIVGGVNCSSLWGLAQGFGYYNEKSIVIENEIKFCLISQFVNLFCPLFDIAFQYGYASKRLASHLNKAAFEWLEKKHEQPFFLYIHYVDAHNPYIPPLSFEGHFRQIDKKMIVNHYSPWDVNYITAEGALFWSVTYGDHVLTDQEKAFLTSRYDCEIYYIDHCLGHLFEKLKDLKLYDDTLIIVTSDHGEAFGEHNHMGHILTLYDELLRVPLIVKYPSTYLRRGVVEKRVSLVDLMPTVLALLNYSIPSGIDGAPIKDSDHLIIAESDVGWWMAQGTITKYLRYLKAMYQGNYKYIWTSNRLNELYDLEKDPGEKENLMQKFPHKAQKMQRALNQWLASFKPPIREGEAVKVNKSTEERLRALGYVR